MALHEKPGDHHSYSVQPGGNIHVCAKLHSNAAIQIFQSGQVDQWAYSVANNKVSELKRKDFKTGKTTTAAETNTNIMKWQNRRAAFFCGQIFFNNCNSKVKATKSKIIGIVLYMDRGCPKTKKQKSAFWCKKSRLKWWQS